MKIKKPDRRSKAGASPGFSLIEMLIVVAMIAILAGVAIPSFASWRQNTLLNGSARDLFSTLKKTRLEAIKAHRNITVKFDTGKKEYTVSYSVYEESSDKKKPTEKTVEEKIDLSRSDSISFGTCTFPDNTNKLLTFNSQGLLKEKSEKTIVVKNKKQSITIKVKPNGMVQMTK